MNGHGFEFWRAQLTALPSGALWWAEARLLCVSDLHLGKSERIARRQGMMLPPYDSRDTLDRLASDIDRTGAEKVICLGDSFDDLIAARELEPAVSGILAPLMAGREWIWIEGNHDPGPLGLGGSHLSEFALGAIRFRHIAQPGARGEVSGHFHPKARVSVRGRGLSRRCFLVDRDRVILPAYGTYTGGLSCADPALAGLMAEDALALILPGRDQSPLRIPMPR